MAGRKKATAPTLPSTSLVASAVRYPGKIAGIYVGAKEWQRECYRHYGICGEARYAATYFGHALARCSLFVTDKAGRGAVPLENGPAVDVLDSLFNGSEGQEAMLDMIGQHLTIAGECYLIGREVEVEDPETLVVVEDELWEVLSVLEVKKAGEKWSITSREEGEPDIVLNEDAVVIRIWRPNPMRRLEADSPFRSLLPVLREIEWLTLRTFAECRSRLTGAGLGFISEDVTFPAPPAEINGTKIAPANDAEGMLFVLANAMMGAIEDPSSPESLMPVLATVPSEVLANGDVMQLIKFWTELDSETRPMREAAIHRFALGMDLPPEKILGMGSNAGSGGGTSNGISHWGAWQIDEETIRLHIEPMLGLVCTALVIGFLRPLTEGMEGIDYDTTNLRLRPDRSKEAIELYKLGVIKAEVVIRENGFDPDDLMDEEGRKLWLTMKVASGSATPEQVQQALEALGVDLGPLLLPAMQPRESRPDPSTQDHPTRDMPEAATLLLSTCEPLVLTALSRAGNKLRQRGKGGVRPSGVKAHEVHTVIEANGLTEMCLDDAFPHAATCLGEQAEKVVPRLDAYVRTLLAQQRPHTRALLTKALEDIL